MIGALLGDLWPYVIGVVIGAGAVVAFFVWLCKRPDLWMRPPW